MVLLFCFNLQTSMFRLQPITVTRVEELYKDIDCKVLLSSGGVTGPISLSRLLSGPALYRPPVVLLPVKDIPQPPAPEVQSDIPQSSTVQEPEVDLNTPKNNAGLNNALNTEGMDSNGSKACDLGQIETVPVLDTQQNGVEMNVSSNNVEMEAENCHVGANNGTKDIDEIQGQSQVQNEGQNTDENQGQTQTDSMSLDTEERSVSVHNVSNSCAGIGTHKN